MKKNERTGRDGIPAEIYFKRSKALINKGEGLVNDVAEKTIDEAEPGSANSKVLRALDRGDTRDGRWPLFDGWPLPLTVTGTGNGKSSCS